MPSVLDQEDLRVRVQKVLDDVLAKHAATLEAVSLDLIPLAEGATELLSGGKRLRPAFCYWGWRGAGGADNPQIIAAATSLELFQAAALIHDDVMDDSDTRRGAPAMHRRFQSLHRGSRWSGSPERFGEAAAILIGDLCLCWSDELLTNSGLPADALARGRVVFDRMRTELMGGQYLDMLEQVLGNVADDQSAGLPGADADPDRVTGSAAEGAETALAAGRTRDRNPASRARTVLQFKSAKYTIEHPLLLGGQLAGAPQSLLDSYSAYGLPLGEAFQLRDDILGVFGDPADTGKPAGDDLREGKRTMLIAYTFEAASPAQATALRRHLGDPHIDASGVAASREIIAETGALARVEAFIDSLVAQSSTALDAAEVNEPARSVLSSLIPTVTARTT